MHDLKDLAGKRLAQPSPGTLAEMLFERILGEVGLRLTDVPDMQHLTYPNVLSAFASGSVDATIAPEPWGAIAEERGIGMRILDVGSYFPGAVVALIVFSERFSQQQPDVAQRFAVAYLRAARDYMDAMEYGRDRHGIIAQLAAATGQEQRVLEQSGYLGISRDGRINVDALKAFLDWQHERGYVPQKPDLMLLIDHQFADYAARILDSRR